jgi:hypothetical protein
MILIIDYELLLFIDARRPESPYRKGSNPGMAEPGMIELGISDLLPVSVHAWSYGHSSYWSWVNPPDFDHFEKMGVDVDVALGCRCTL